MRQANLSTELLRTFITIIEVDGFNRAAKHLHKTQSTISQNIKRLEQEVGTELFVSQGRRKVLSPGGELLLGYAKRMLTLQDDALSAIRQTQLSDSIRMGISSSLSEGVLTEILTQFTRCYPEIKLSVETGYSKTLIERYHAGEYDLTLTLEQGMTEGEVLAVEKVVWVGPHGFEWSNSRPLPIAAFEHPCQFRSILTKSLNDAEIPWQMVYSANSHSAVMASVRAGLGITVRNESSVWEDTEILTPRMTLPTLPKIQLALRNRTKHQASELMANALKQTQLTAFKPI
ncbi:MAG: LysR substrate-binding domain-containing protein [Arenicella sp.]